MDDAKAVATALPQMEDPRSECKDGHVHLLVDGYYQKKKSAPPKPAPRSAHVAAVPKVREWMKKTQRECIQFGNLVMEGRDDRPTNVFPETDFKFYLDAHLEEHTKRRAAEGAE